MKPLRDRIIVKLDESLPTVSGIFIKPVTTAWREARDQLSNRGTVVSVGQGKRHRRTGNILPVSVKEGDVIKFSELVYPTIKRDGNVYVVIMDADIVGIE